MDSILRISGATGVEADLKIAGPGARSYAFIVDWHIRLLLALAGFVLVTLVHAGGLRFLPLAEPGSAGLSGSALWTAGAIYFLYHPVLEVLMRGRTPGKRYVGVRLVAHDGGGAPGAGALLIRNVLRLIDCLPLFYAVGLITTLLTRQSVRLGDMAAGTVLVYDAPPHALDSTSTAAEPRLGLERARLLSELLDRWDELGDVQRSALARQLLEAAGAAAPVSDAELHAALEKLLA